MFSVHLYQYMLIYLGYLEKQNKGTMGGGGNGRKGALQWEGEGMAMGGRVMAVGGRVGDGFD